MPSGRQQARAAQDGEVAGNFRGRQFPGVGQLAGDARAAGQGAQEPPPYRMRERVQPSRDRVQGYRLRWTRLGDGALHHRLPPGRVDRHQVRPAEDSGEKGDAVAVGVGRIGDAPDQPRVPLPDPHLSA